MKTESKPGGIKRHNWETRIYSKIKKTKSCWRWMGLTSQGYGYAKWHHRMVLVHRVIFEIERGPIPKSLVLDHLCRVRDCVNPSHLEIVTHRTNILRGKGACAKNARKAHCKYGHPLSGLNVYTDPGTRFRRCRKCIARRTKEWVQRKRNVS